MPEPIDNYRGPTDPRQLPLLISPFNSTPLHVDHAEHVRFQDAIIRGAGYTAILLDHGIDIEFDNVTVWCGTYGLRALCTGPLRFANSALHGNLAPWTFRADAGKRDYPGRVRRRIHRPSLSNRLRAAQRLIVGRIHAQALGLAKSFTYARISVISSPPTSVRRKSRPLKRCVSLVCSSPSKCSSVACKSLTWTLFSTALYPNSSVAP